MPPRQRYPTDLTDAQWALLAPLIPPGRPGGRPRSADMRAVVDAILYAVRNGCTWRALPHDYPPWKTVYHSARSWRLAGTWECIHDALSTRVRMADGRNPIPSAAILDRPVGEDDRKRGPRGYDAGKTGTGRKRHLVVDTLGLILAVAVHAADVQDRDGAKLVLAKLRGRYPRLALIWADGGYAGQLLAWALATGGWAIEIVKKPQGASTFAVLPKRWIVERTFAWLGRSRRLSKDYEGRPETSEAVIRIAMIHLMLKRLAR